MAFSVSSQLRGGGKACDAVQTDLLLCLVIAASFAEEMALPVSAVWLMRPGRMKKRTCFSLQYAGTDAHRGKSALSWQMLILC